MPPRLLSLLPCCVHLSLHTGPCAPTLYSARALRARYQFGRKGKHDVGRVGGDVTGAGVIEDFSSTIAFATWHQRFGSVINRRRSASFVVSLVLSLFLRFGADLRGMRTFAYSRLSFDYDASKGGRRTLTQRMSRRSDRFVRI